MSLQSRLSALITAIGADIKKIEKIGDLTQLTTTAKGNLVAALNEVAGLVAAASGIDDLATATTTTWSSQKIYDQIAAAITALVDGAPAALDTLNELATMLDGQDSAVSGLVASVAGKLSFAETQSLTTEQRARACANAGVGDPETDLVALYAAAKA